MQLIFQDLQTNGMSDVKNKKQNKKYKLELHSGNPVAISEKQFK